MAELLVPAAERRAAARPRAPSSALRAIAMAMAMGGGFLPDNKKFAFATNYGSFAGQGAMAVTALARISDNIVVSGAAGYGFDGTGQFGGRAGLQFAW